MVHTLSVLPKVKAEKGKICWFKRVPPGGMEIEEEGYASNMAQQCTLLLLVKSE
jgi:hypothetical protein